MKSKSQSGFAHLGIITAVLVIALIGSLGYIFWQRNSESNSDSSNQPSSASDTTKKSNSDVNDEIILGEFAYDQTFGSKIAIKYPSTWTITHTDGNASSAPMMADVNTITSPDGSITITMRAGLDGIGGMCDTSDESHTMALYNINQLQNYSDYSYFETVSNAGSSSPGNYFYRFVVEDNTTANQSLSVGNGSACGLGMGVFRSKTGNFISTLTLVFNNIDNTKTNTLSEVQSAMKSDTYTVAKRIMLSLYEK